MTKCCPSFLLHKESILIVSKNIKNILRKAVLNIALAASLSSVAALLHAGGTNVPKHDSKQMKCIVDMAYHESRGESTKGMVATVFVLLNRLEDERFPKTPCSIVYQKGQYEWVGKGAKVKEPKLYEQSREVVNDVLSGRYPDYSKGAIFFNSNHKPPVFGAKCTTRIGGHSFWKVLNN